MSHEINRIETQLQLAFEGAAWHGPSVLEALEGVSAEMAYAHPVAGVHSIWELTLHLTGTYRLDLRRLEGDDTPLAASEDWPTVSEPTSSQWQETIRALRELNSKLQQAVLRFDSDRLDKPLVADPPYTAYTQLIGITQHDLYHAGQIVILKRALKGHRIPLWSDQTMHNHHAIDYVEFTVKDLAEAKRFYAAAFGWTFNDYGPEYAGIRGNDGEVGGLHQTTQLRSGGPLVILYSDDLDASLSAVRAAGGTIVQEPFPFPGGRRFHFTDPSGNELAVWSPA